MVPVETIKKQFGIVNLMRAIALLSEYLMIDERTQVNGYQGLEDMTNMSMSHIYNLYTKEINDTWMKFYSVSSVQLNLATATTCRLTEAVVIDSCSLNSGPKYCFQLKISALLLTCIKLLHIIKKCFSMYIYLRLV